MRELHDPVNTQLEIVDEIPRGPRVSNMGGAMSPGAVACFTFDNMAEAADVGAGTRTNPLPAGTDPSLAIGFPRVFDLLDRHGVRATFFVEGWNGDHHPDAVAEIVRREHELGMHGWVHEPWAALAVEDERALAARATDALALAAGVRPRGFRAPGGHRTPATAAVLRDLGYEYDASLGNRMRIERLPEGIAQIPFVWPCVDGFHYLRADPAPADAVRDRWLAELARVAERGGLFLVIAHAFLSGVDEDRLGALDAVLAAAVADPRVTIRTAGELARALPRQEAHT
jgi:peptidoglycan/xylan/chitin deacetylase (PgdA/CDA1 family)